MHQWLLDERKDLVERIEKASKFDDALSNEMKAALTEFKKEYVKDRSDVVAA